MLSYSVQGSSLEVQPLHRPVSAYSVESQGRVVTISYDSI